MITKDFDLEDVFLVSEIIDKMEIEADIEAITSTIKNSKTKNKKDATAVGEEVMMALGINIAMKVVKKLYKSRKEVIQLMSNMTGLSTEEVSKMGIKQLKDFFSELVKHEGFGDFLAQAGE